MRRRQLDVAAKVFCFFCGWSCVSETAAYITAIIYHNNTQLYVVANIVEMAFISLYFNFSIDYFRKRKLGIWIALLSISLGIMNTVWLQPASTMNTYFMVYEGILTVSICLFAFARLLMADNDIELRNSPHFWFMMILVGYWTFTLLCWGVFPFFIEGGQQQYGQFLSIFIITMNIVTYSGYGLIFFLHPKMMGDKDV